MFAPSILLGNRLLHLDRSDPNEIHISSLLLSFSNLFIAAVNTIVFMRLKSNVTVNHRPNVRFQIEELFKLLYVQTIHFVFQRT